MNRKGIEFTLLQIAPGLWQWTFQIGETTMTGKTQTKLKGLAAHRVQQRIDRELNRAFDLRRSSEVSEIAPTTYLHS